MTAAESEFLVHHFLIGARILHLAPIPSRKNQRRENRDGLVLERKMDEVSLNWAYSLSFLHKTTIMLCSMLKIEYSIIIGFPGTVRNVRTKDKADVRSYSCIWGIPYEIERSKTRPSLKYLKLFYHLVLDERHIYKFFQIFISYNFKVMKKCKKRSYYCSNGHILENMRFTKKMLRT